MTLQLRVSHLSDPRQIANAIKGVQRRTDPIDVSADQSTLTVDRPVNATTGYQIASVQVVGPRQAGWAADTGTGSTASHATYAAGTTLTYSSSYVQSEQTAMATRMAQVEAALQTATQEIKSLKDMALTHGLIGT